MMKHGGITRRGVIGAGLVGLGTFALPLSWAATDQDRPATVVETSQGKVRGARVNGIERFLGIPYGEDTSKHRFQPPRPAQPWSGVRECVQAGAKTPQGMLTLDLSGGAPMQPGGAGLSVVMAVAKATAGVSAESEECLFLNVYTPAPDSAKRPVMVWLHGGGFAMGSGYEPMSEASELSRRGDLVVVSLNHRLNALGYLYLGDIHDDFADSGNSGQLDILLALQWVRDNIAAFGGDPGNVTIFGESGGGCKVGAMMAMPAAKGLFHKAIEQSGPAVRLVSKDDASAIAERTLAELGIARADVHQLQTLPYRQVIQAATKSSQRNIGKGIIEGTLAPLVDGRNIPAHPYDPQATAISRDVPLMIGSCKDECTLFLAGDAQFAKLTTEQVRARFEAILGERGAAAFEVYRQAAPEDQPSYWVSSLLTDLMFRTGTIVQADRKASQNAAPVFVYRVDYEPRVLDRLLRTPHGTEVPLLFDTKLPPEYIGSGPEVDTLSDTVMQAWINFARSGDPSQTGLSWPRYTAENRLHMILDAPCRVVADPDKVTREYWTTA